MLNIANLGTRFFVWVIATAIIHMEALGETANRFNEDHGILVVAEPRPGFPLSLWNEGIATGQATLAVTVDENGTLEDWLVIEATHTSLVAAIEAVVEQWVFEPAVVEGTTIHATQCLPLLFDTSQLLTSERMSENRNLRENHYLAKRSQSFRRNPIDNSLRFAKPSALDQYPEPLVRPRPLLTQAALEESRGSRASFKFYIDTFGNARMPTLFKLYGKVATEALLAWQEALKSWRFKPLTSNGKPVVVEVVQSFEFSHLYSSD